MASFLKDYIIKLLKEATDKIDAGTCEIDEDQAMEIINIINHQALSRDQACNYIHLSNSEFYKLIKLGKIPKGKKVKGFKELRWYKNDLDNYLKNKNK